MSHHQHNQHAEATSLEWGWCRGQQQLRDEINSTQLPVESDKVKNGRRSLNWDQALLREWIFNKGWLEKMNVLLLFFCFPTGLSKDAIFYWTGQAWYLITKEKHFGSLWFTVYVWRHAVVLDFRFVCKGFHLRDCIGWLGLKLEADSIYFKTLRTRFPETD